MKTLAGKTVRQVQLCTWQLEAVGGQRKEWESITPRRTGDSLAVPGVYIYWGRQGGNPLLSVYAGQTDAVSFRLSDHHKKCTWLQHAIGVYAHGSPLDRSLLRALEVALVRQLHDSSTTEMLHVNTVRQELPIPVERFLGAERHEPAKLLLDGARELIITLAPDIDPVEGPRVARSLSTRSS